MTTAGWIFMFGSVIAVLSLAIWCYAKILTQPPAESDEDAGEPNRPPTAGNPASGPG